MKFDPIFKLLDCVFRHTGSSRKEYSLAAEKSPTFSRQLLFLDRMVLDHLQIYYKDAMEKTVIGKRVKKPENSECSIT